MQKFEWKRKHSVMKKEIANVFSSSSQNNEDALSDEDVDWLEPVKRAKVLVLEDGAAKAERLKKEGVILAEANKWWSAIKQWGAAISYQPGDHTLHEMMAQAYMQVGEFIPSIGSAEESVRLAPTWWCGHQTLGRALMGIGELHRAVLCFSVSLRLNPDNPELREHDLKWASQLLSSYKLLHKQNEAAKQTEKQQKEQIQEEEEKSLQIIDLKENPDALSLLKDEETKDSSSKTGSSDAKYGQGNSSSDAKYEQRNSLPESTRFISCCSSNKSGQPAKNEPQTIDLSQMVCMRPKFPSR